MGVIVHDDGSLELVESRSRSSREDGDHGSHHSHQSNAAVSRAAQSEEGDIGSTRLTSEGLNIDQQHDGLFLADEAVSSSTSSRKDEHERATVTVNEELQGLATGSTLTFLTTPIKEPSRTDTLTTTGAQDAAIPATPKFKPLADANRIQFAQDAKFSRRDAESSALYSGGRRLRRGPSDTSNPAVGNGLPRSILSGYRGEDYKPSSSDSLPLQRVESHGRDSIMELDLADHAMEPISASDHATPSLHERARRRRRIERQRRRRASSISSRQTKRTVRFRAENAIKLIRDRTRRGSNSSATSSGSSASSTGSSSSARSSSSSGSSSGLNWRFWRTSSASSSTDDDDSSYIPPQPSFTLFTPKLTHPLATSALPSENDLSNLLRNISRVPHPYTSKSSERRERDEGKAMRRDSQGTLPATMLSAPPVFDTVEGQDLSSTLEKLCAFWQERDQIDTLGGDIGAAHQTTPASSPGDSPIDSRPGLTRYLSVPEYIKSEMSRKTRDAGPAWWLDVQSPTAADMRQLRRLIPLHPLTMEDILAQETREKIEVHEKLGYYFVAFRALDETYFRYSESSASSSSSSLDTPDEGPFEDKRDAGLVKPVESSTGSAKEQEESPVRTHNSPFSLLSLRRTLSRDPNRGDASMSEKGDVDSKEPRQRRLSTHSTDSFGGGRGRPKGKVEIVEGYKEGVEGVGVGAVNVYMVVFRDGIITFHFEDISKHVTHVRDRIQQFGDSRHISSHWIAYGLMDSIVDTFFPIIDYIESESNEIDAFLADPLSDPRQPTRSDIKISTSMDLSPRFLFKIHVPKGLQSRLPFFLARHLKDPPKLALPFDSIGDGKHEGHSVETENYRANKYDASLAPRTLDKKSLLHVDDKLYNRGKMLKRIADSRKLITGLSRLLIPKQDVVRGLRKRLVEEVLGINRSEPGRRHDINVYLGDLQDHIVTMHQTLTFFDTMFAHDHPAYLGVLRLAFEAAKIGNDKAIVRLYIVVLTVIPINIFCGIFSMNVHVPHTGVWGTPYNEDGTLAGYTTLACVLAGFVVIAALMIFLVYWVFKSTRKTYERKASGAPL